MIFASLIISRSLIIGHSTLAVVPDYWVVGFGITNLIANVVLALVVMSLNSRQRRMEGLENDLVKRNDQLVDAKFAVMSGRLQGSIDSLNDALDRVNERMKTGEGEIGEMLKGSHGLEMRVAQQVGQVKDFVREFAASKDDVRKIENRVENLTAQIRMSRGRGNP